MSSTTSKKADQITVSVDLDSDRHITIVSHLVRLLILGCAVSRHLEEF